MTAAARHLGAPGLISQIERIEAELGFELFVRAERGRSMQLTDNGRRVLAAIRTAQRARARRSPPR
jgi:DNA-binding transcriptional LysR family regulator